MASPSLSRLFGPPGRRFARPEWQRDGLSLHAIPPTLRTVDLGFAAEWRTGSFPLAGHSVAIGAGSPFAILDAPHDWLAALHGFGWLRHVALHHDPDAEARVTAVVSDWLASHADRSPIAASDGVTARRLLSWLTHADLLLQTSDARFYDAVLRSLATDIARLETRWRALDRPGERLLALIALAAAGSCLEKADALRLAAEAAIADECDVRHRSSLRKLLRHPDALADLLLDLEALRLLYGMRGQPVPTAIGHAKTMFCDALAGLMLGTDHLARLGSPRTTAEQRIVMAGVERHVGLSQVASCHNTDAGYVRLSLGETRLVADIGAPFRSTDALAIEVISGGAPMIVHDGVPPSQSGAARGTVVYANAASPTAPRDSQRTTPVLEPTTVIDVDIDDPSVVSVDATHAGAAAYGFVHRRRAVLSEAGRRLDGTDELRPLVGRDATSPTRFAVRFVLHPSVTATRAPTPDQLELMLANGHRWTLHAAGRTLSVEAALYRDGLRTVPTLQVLLPADTEGDRTVAWHWLRVD